MRVPDRQARRFLQLLGRGGRLDQRLEARGRVGDTVRGIEQRGKELAHRGGVGLSFGDAPRLGARGRDVAVGEGGPRESEVCPARKRLGETGIDGLRKPRARLGKTLAAQLGVREGEHEQRWDPGAGTMAETDERAAVLIRVAGIGLERSGPVGIGGGAGDRRRENRHEQRPHRASTHDVASSTVVGDA